MRGIEVRGLAESLRFRRKAKGINVSRQEFFDTRPLRNPSLRWERTKNGTVTVFISYEKSRLASIISKIPKEKQVMLDKVGSRVWDFCDGNHTIKKIAETMHQEYKLTMEEAEAALRAYFNQLSERGLVGFILPNEAQARSEKMKT
jgi:hypothetical protein